MPLAAPDGSWKTCTVLMSDYGVSGIKVTLQRERIFDTRLLFLVAALWILCQELKAIFSDFHFHYVN